MDPARSLALIDANLNRCREGLRVLDDLSRFLLGAPTLCAQIKQARHQLVAAESVLRQVVPNLLSYRDVTADVGTSISVDNEMSRADVGDIAAANVRRVQEALRSLEEFGKLHSAAFAQHVKQLRYRSYELEQRLSAALHHQADQAADNTDQDSRHEVRLQKLAQADIYVLITESLCYRPWKETVQACAERASVLQLREKEASNRELLRKARWLSDVCRETGCLAIINDRPDILQMCAADGIHVGQDDACVDDIRTMVGPSCLIGLSTHDAPQLTDAHRQSADYFGVGPVFPSGTKSFQEFPGLRYVAAAAATAGRPWFPIGGIDHTNVAQVAAAGARTVAVCGHVIGSADPGGQITQLRHVLETALTERQSAERSVHPDVKPQADPNIHHGSHISSAPSTASPVSADQKVDPA